MSAKPLVQFSTETEFINEVASYGPLSLKLGGIMETMREHQIDVTDVVHIMETGQVVRSDMIEQLGLWTVIGETVDEMVLEIEIAIASEECEVELLGFTIINGEK